MTFSGQTPVDATFHAFGIDALYVPQGHDPIPIRVLPKRGDVVLDFGETRVAVDSLFFEVRVSELASPQENALLQIGDQDYLIQAEPQREDVLGLVWVLDTRKA
jgi:hypothetical protein